jgi:hypothetical protein
MNSALVIVRAFGGRPLKRAVVREGRTVNYVADPTRLQAVENGESGAIGFPWNDVFIYEDQIFIELESEWKIDGTTNPQTWALLKTYVRVGSAHV